MTNPSLPPGIAWSPPTRRRSRPPAGLELGTYSFSIVPRRVEIRRRHHVILKPDSFGYARTNPRTLAQLRLRGAGHQHRRQGRHVRRNVWVRDLDLCDPPDHRARQPSQRDYRGRLSYADAHIFRRNAGKGSSVRLRLPPASERRRFSQLHSGPFFGSCDLSKSNLVRQRLRSGTFQLPMAACQGRRGRP